MQTAHFTVVFICFGLYAPQTADAVTEDYDLQIHGSLIVAPKVIQNIKGKVLTFLRNNNVPDFVDIELSKPVNEDFKKKFDMLLSRKADVSILSLLSNYLKIIIQSGTKTLNQVARIVHQNVLTKPNMTSLLQMSISNYVAHLQAYVLGLSVNTLTNLDKDTVFSNVIETSVKFIKEEEFNMLLPTVKAENLTKEETIKIGEAISKLTFNNLRNDYIELCKSQDVCRPFPSYTFFLAELIHFLLNYLPDDEKFDYVISRFLDDIKNNDIYAKSVLGETVLSIMGPTGYNHNVTKTKIFLTRVHEIIYNRNMIMSMESQILIDRITSARILLNIIDKTYVIYNEEKTVLNMDSILKSVSLWSANENPNIDNDIRKYVSYTFSTLTHVWDAEIENEVKTLIEFLRNGKATDEQLFKKVMEHNSKCIDDAYKQHLSKTNQTTTEFPLN